MPARTPISHVYAGPYVDRAAELRADGCAEGIACRAPRVVPVWATRSLVTATAGPGESPAAVLLHWDQAAELIRESSSLILLGEFHGELCVALAVSGPDPPTIPGTEFADLRAIGGLLTSEEAGLLGYARAMVLWRQRHAWCGTCGAPTEPRRAGHLMVCANAACGTPHFPRIDPAIIVLVTDGEGPSARALLGRQAHWPSGRYSTIAGFVEPGESLEDAVRREVAEETGIRIGALEYHSSQPWPFPASLMLGFNATAVSFDVRCADGELEDARWFSREDLATEAILLPPRQSISWRLIEDWRAGR